MRVTDSSLFSRFLAGFRTTRQDMARASESVLDQKRVRVASDDPFGASTALELRGRLVRIEGYDRSAQSARADLATMDTVLGTVVELVSEVRTKAMEGASGVLGSTNAVRADDVASIRSRLIQLANTNQRGRYLFSGTETLTSPFDAAGAYAGDDNETSAPLDFSQEVSTTMSGRRVFQDAAGDLFAQLDALVTAMRADDQAAIQAIVPDLTAQIEHLTNTHAEVGYRMRRVDEALATHDDERVRLQTRISQVEDMPLEEAAFALNDAQNRLSALSATAARVLGRSLFDFLR